MALVPVLITRLSSLHRATPHNDASTSEGASSLPSRALTHSHVQRPSSPSNASNSSPVYSPFDSRSCRSELLYSSDASASVVRPRYNEHLAVLLPKWLWKPDSQAAYCDTFMCRKAFSIWERRHHCRKCGGVFCSDCSSRTTTLLDASRLSFLHPPRNVPITVYDSPISRVLDRRVCNDCWDQINGTKTPRSSLMSTASPITLVRAMETSFGASSLSSSVATPPDGCPINSLTSRAPPRRTRTSPRIPASLIHVRSPIPHAGSVLTVGSELSLGDLDLYPLRHASEICKKNGGGRWEPKPIPEYVTKCIPGCKAAYELELEREEEERRIRRVNPIIHDGDFQLRCPREIEPPSPGGPFTLSTF